MRLLLDSHILLAISLDRLENVCPVASRLLDTDGVTAWASAASLWEIAIKTRLGKLDPGMPVEHLADYFRSIGIDILAIDEWHAVTAAEPLPVPRDPFDRMLLTQCAIEGLLLVTLDSALRDHPLALPLVR